MSTPAAALNKDLKKWSWFMRKLFITIIFITATSIHNGCKWQIVQRSEYTVRIYKGWNSCFRKWSTECSPQCYCHGLCPEVAEIWKQWVSFYIHEFQYVGWIMSHFTSTKWTCLHNSVSCRVSKSRKSYIYLCIFAPDYACFSIYLCLLIKSMYFLSVYFIFCIFILPIF